jgi:hypothetical protein
MSEENEHALRVRLDINEETAEYIENLEYENKQMALFLEKLGYSNEAISLICVSDEITPEEVTQ